MKRNTELVMKENDKIKQDNDDIIHVYQSAVQHCNIAPHFYVLDMGYDTGHGLREILKQLTGGSGRVIGTETSESKMIDVSRQFHNEIRYGTLELTLCTSDNMPFITNMFECVYTVNGIHSWTDIDKTLKEVYRVLRPGCVFLTCFHDLVTTTMVKNCAHSTDYTAVEYVEKLKENGFVKVKIQEHRDAESGFKYHLIKAFTPERKDGNL